MISMTRGGFFLVTAAVVLGGAGIVMLVAAEPETKPKTITVTEAQLEEIVQKRIAAVLIQEEQTLDATILDGKNWHTAVFQNPGGRPVQYTIYTGPGKVVSQQWYTPPTPEKPTEKPAEKPKP